MTAEMQSALTRKLYSNWGGYRPKETTTTT